MQRLALIGTVATWSLLAAAAGLDRPTPADPGQPAKPSYGIDKRLPLTTSRVIGSPDPLPPYRVRKLFPNLRVDFPVAVTHQPGSDRLLIITQTRSYGPTKLQRFIDDP